MAPVDALQVRIQVPNAFLYTTRNYNPLSTTQRSSLAPDKALVAILTALVVGRNDAFVIIGILDTKQKISIILHIRTVTRPVARTGVAKITKATAFFCCIVVSLD
jgi:hypothetical protein